MAKNKNLDIIGLTILTVFPTNKRKRLKKQLILIFLLETNQFAS